MHKKPLVIFVVGPTATGKSDFAVEAAESIGGEIINTDSIQVYESVEIGTAKPPKEFFARVPHHLYSYVKEGETSTAGEYRRHALEIVGASPEQTFFATGGSGFYVQAFEKGMYPVPEIPAIIRTKIDQDAESSGLAKLYDELRLRDSRYAAEISANDTYRIKRALEIVRFLQGDLPQGQPDPEKTWSGIRDRFTAESAQSRPFRVLKIGLIRDRALIRKSVEQRTKKMLEAGFIDEVKALRAKGLSNWAPMLSVGYKEVQMHLDGQIAFADLAQEITTSTMQLVKRQTTWFRRDPEIKWFDPGEGWEKPLTFLRSAL